MKFGGRDTNEKSNVIRDSCIAKVGKTSLTTSFVNGNFSQSYDPTIESTFHKTIRFRRVHFATDIIDTAGIDEYSRLSRNASVGVHGYVMVYSIASEQSFEKIQQINTTLLNMLGDAPDVPRILVGSMSDLQGERKVGLPFFFFFLCS